MAGESGWLIEGKLADGPADVDGEGRMENRGEKAGYIAGVDELPTEILVIGETRSEDDSREYKFVAESRSEQATSTCLPNVNPDSDSFTNATSKSFMPLPCLH